MTAKEARAQQWKSLKDKPLSAKLKYIFTYYWAAILGCVCVIAFFVSWISSALLQKELALGGYLLNGATRQDYAGNFAQEFLQEQQIDTDQYTFNLMADTYYSAAESSSTALYALESIAAQNAAGQLDFIITDMDTYPTLSAYFADLRTVFTAEQLEKYKPYLVYVEQSELDELTSADLGTSLKLPQYHTEDTDLEDPVPIGVRLPESSRLFDAYMFSEGDVIFGITHPASHISNALAFLEYLFN